MTDSPPHPAFELWTPQYPLNEPLRVASDGEIPSRISAEAGGRSHSLLCPKVEIVFLPTPKVRLCGCIARQNESDVKDVIEMVNTMLNTGRVHTTICARTCRVSAEGVIESLDFDLLGSTARLSIILNLPRDVAENSASCITFLLCNFKKFQKPMVPRYHKDGSFAVPQIRFCWDGWRFEIVQRYDRVGGDRGLRTDQDHIFKQLQARGGYGITHVGSLARCDGTTFSIAEGLDVLREFGLALSFLGGRWCPIMWPKAIGADRDIEWESYWLPRSMWENYPVSCFEWDASIIAEFLPKFLDRVRDPSWKDFFEEVVWFYTLANEGRVRGAVGIVLAAAALERIVDFWSKTKQRKIDSKDEQDTVMYRELGIPFDPPGAEIVGKIKKRSDGIDKGTTIIRRARNGILHPKPNDVIRVSDYVEIWNMGMWYVEMCVLALCGYTGLYSNRLALGRNVSELEPVPWA